MPVVYVAIGQRLGLPVYLVQTRGHLFFRWDDSRGTLIDWDSPRVQVWIPPDRFNVEGSGEGIAYPDDDHFRTWPESWTAADTHHDRYLRSMNSTEVLAEFLIQRAECFYDLRNWDSCLKSIFYARQLAPDDLRYQSLHAKYTREFQQQQDTARRNSIINQIRHAAPVSRPGMPGHSRGCCCGECDQYRNAVAALPVAPHGGGCRCKACQKLRRRSLAWSVCSDISCNVPASSANNCGTWRKPVPSLRTGCRVSVRLAPQLVPRTSPRGASPAIQYIADATRVPSVGTRSRGCLASGHQVT